MLYGSFFVTIIINIVIRQYLLLIYYFLHSLYNIFITGSNLWSKRSQSLIRNFKSPIGLWEVGVVVGKNELCKPFTSPHPTSCCFKSYFKFLFSCSVVFFTMLIFRAVVLLFFSMSCRKRRRWHFRDPKFKNFPGEHAPRLPQVWGAYGALTFLPLRAPSKSHATLLTTGILQLMKSMRLKGWRRNSKRVGGGGVHFKNCYYQVGWGVQFLCVFILGEVKFWYTTLFRKLT